MTAENSNSRRGSDSERKTAPAPSPKAGQSIDRRHWASRIGISFGTLKNPNFKKVYPFESRLQDIGGYNYHYLDEGEGEPVVMVHGNPTWSFFYRKLINGLRHQYRCMVPDHMGCGFSEKPKNYRYTLEQHIVNLETWLESNLPPAGWNGGKINLVVHDWGGPIGFGYAVRHPERINRIIVLNSSIFTAGKMPLRIQVCGVPYLGAFLVRGLNLFASFAAEMTTVKKIPYRIQKYFTMPYNSWRNRVGIYRFIQDIPYNSGKKSHKILRKIADLAKPNLGDKPMLVQWGMKDWCFTPEFLKLWKKEFPEAEHDQYNAGHYLLEDCGDEILARIRTFLQRPV